ncbi:MAG TPA: cytoplasmic protein [Syntrophales bacterium]|nr:cytoplasmic protein [Syntrophales bacterium]HOX95221.1 cytoplasmic protein [Syntrophales bacterium]HPI56462.1 cytoplasmic protein [Syntrophales bacterium]HPN25117.1 cytoplasmic protein [Syntrophales bacterium]HQM29140.1 cytoplasmic protein [Syntrophales bacterium]
MSRGTYRDFDAKELFCLNCRRAVPVRKKLLLILTSGEKYDYTCVFCGTSVGDKVVTQKDPTRVIIK